MRFCWHAGLARLGRADAISQVLPLDVMLPAPGQGALGIQCRDEAATRGLLAPLDDAPTHRAVTAERAFLAGLGGGCAVPIAAFAAVEDGRLHLHGRVTAADGTRQIAVEANGPMSDAESVGRRLAQHALAQGGRRRSWQRAGSWVERSSDAG
jgi:hydroxymethylbilane synthase